MGILLLSLAAVACLLSMICCFFLKRKIRKLPRSGQNLQPLSRTSQTTVPRMPSCRPSEIELRSFELDKKLKVLMVYYKDSPQHEKTVEALADYMNVSATKSASK